jgi:hypothetical protein
MRTPSAKVRLERRARLLSFALLVVKTGRRDHLVCRDVKNSSIRERTASAAMRQLDPVPTRWTPTPFTYSRVSRIQMLIDVWIDVAGNIWAANNGNNLNAVAAPETSAHASSRRTGRPSAVATRRCTPHRWSGRPTRSRGLGGGTGT